MSATVDPIEEAQREAAEAAALAESLQERVRDGDNSVTPDELEAASKLGKFARLRVEAAERKTERARQADFEARAEKIRARGQAVLGHDSLESQAKSVAKALRGLIVEHAEYDVQFTSLRAQIKQLEPEGADTAALRLGWDTGGSGRAVTIGDDRQEPVSIARIVRALLYETHQGPDTPDLGLVLANDGGSSGSLFARLGWSV